MAKKYYVLKYADFGGMGYVYYDRFDGCGCGGVSRPKDANKAKTPAGLKNLLKIYGDSFVEEFCDDGSATNAYVAICEVDGKTVTPIEAFKILPKETYDPEYVDPVYVSELVPCSLDEFNAVKAEMIEDY